jgi:hypothetical protein
MEIEQTMQQMLQQLLAMQEKVEANRIGNREMLKGMMEEMNVKRNSKQEEMLARMREDSKSGQAEMRPMICAIRSELKETIRVTRAATEPIRAELDETTTCHEVTEADMEKTKPYSGMMQSVAEHQVALMEDAVAQPVKGRKKQHRGRKPAAGQRVRPKEMTRGD